MTMTDELRKLVIKRTPGSELKKLAVSQGMQTLRTAALEKVRAGLTTLQQVMIITSNH
ncbi:MAG: hypothetical protein LR011_01955 [Verrucomicrobia bacterium]|nr:hypothetical protein [Verrucomicrobiota bacterium]